MTATRALAVYALLAWMVLDRGAGLGTHLLGYGADPQQTVWFLAWGPWAVAHHAMSFTSTLQWQPVGQNLAWTTCVPLLALLGAPLTVLGGALLTFNVFTLAAPVLAAGAAYALCRELRAPPFAAFFGGLYFGFGSYQAAELFSHLNLDFCALVPLLALVAVRRVRGGFSRGGAALALGALLGAQCLINPEILATSCLLGALTWALAWALHPAARPALRALVLDTACAAPLALLIAAPLLWAMVFGPHDMAHPPGWRNAFSVDALNLILPAQVTWIGGGLFALLSSALFGGGLDEQGGYLGLPLLVVAVLAWRRRGLRLPLAALGLSVVLALGGQLRVVGTSMPLPWALVQHLPLLGEALPSRLMLYADLAGGVLLALWLAEADTPKRRLIVALACTCVLPVPRPAQPDPGLVFFAPGHVQAALGDNPRLLILPFGDAGASDYWQAESGFAFTLVGGYLSFPPRWGQADPAVMELFSNTFLPGFPARFVALCRLRGVQDVVLAPGAPPEERAVLDSLGWPRDKVDDVVIYTVPRP